jgi:predicted dehydrogenase
MAPHAESSDSLTSNAVRLPAPGKPPFSKSPPRLVIVGAGSRGDAFGKAIKDHSNGIFVSVVEPIALKRKQFGRRYIWGKSSSSEGQEFEDWKDFLTWETERRSKAALGQEVIEGCDGIFICVQDRLHKDVILGLAPLGIHIMCEKPLATNLADCVDIFKAVRSNQQLFSIGHVLRYSPHNMLLRKLLLEEKVIGEITYVNHTEPIGWWHFAHSFVRSVIAAPFRLHVTNNFI